MRVLHEKVALKEIGKIRPLFFPLILNTVVPRGAMTNILHEERKSTLLRRKNSYCWCDINQSLRHPAIFYYKIIHLLFV